MAYDDETADALTAPNSSPPRSERSEISEVVASEPYVSFDEFRLYFETADAVTQDRKSLNRFNYTITTAILLALGVIAKFGIDDSGSRVLAGGLIFVFSGLAVIFCVYWIAQIDDAKKLNKAKFDILEMMAPRIYFDGVSENRKIESFLPFVKEWDALQRSNGLSSVGAGRRKIDALRGSKAEYFVPKSLCLVFVSIFTLMIAIAIVNHDLILQNPIPKFDQVGDGHAFPYATRVGNA